MKFNWVTIHVRDFEKSLKFYHEFLGLEIAQRTGGGGMEMAMLGEKGMPKIELITHGDGVYAECSGVSVGFEVESIEKAMDYVRENEISILRGPITPNPGISFFFIEDPDGVEVQLVEQRK
jgi:Predicted enzyme related to lactoylglutathione lyase